MRMIGTNRCKRRCRDSARDSRARGDAVPFLEKLGHCGWRSGATARDRRLSERPHVAEALACSLVLTRDDEGAREILRVLKRITLEDDERAGWWAELRRGTRGPVEDDWVVEVWKRGARIEEVLARSSTEAIRLLDEWNEEQLRDLRLPKTA
jgi:hypothetical protein